MPGGAVSEKSPVAGMVGIAGAIPGGLPGLACIVGNGSLPTLAAAAGATSRRVLSAGSLSAATRRVYQAFWGTRVGSRSRLIARTSAQANNRPITASAIVIGRTYQ